MPIKDLKDAAENPIPTRATRALRQQAKHLDILRRNIDRQSLLYHKTNLTMSPGEPLLSISGNRRKSNRAKPSQKERDNIAQQQEGLTVHEDGTIKVMDTSEESTNTEVIQWLVKTLAAQDAAIVQLKQHCEKIELQNEAIMRKCEEGAQQMAEMKAEWARSQQRAEELEIRLHRIQEQNFTGVGAPVLTP